MAPSIVKWGPSSAQKCSVFCSTSQNEIPCLRVGKLRSGVWIKTMQNIAIQPHIACQSGSFPNSHPVRPVYIYKMTFASCGRWLPTQWTYPPFPFEFGVAKGVDPSVWNIAVIYQLQDARSQDILYISHFSPSRHVRSSGCHT